MVKLEDLKPESWVKGIQISQYLDEVMSHLQVLPGAVIDLRVEVQVRVPDGIDETTARIVMENSNALKLDHVSLE